MAKTRNRQPDPLPSGFWFVLFAIPAIPICWMWLRIPVWPFILIGLVAGGATAQYPKTRTRSEEPDPRKMAAYKRWKIILKGLVPNKAWTCVWRTSWWMWPLLGLTTSLNSPYPWVGPVNMLCAWWAGMGVQQWIDRRRERRHPCTGVSVGAFYKKAPVWQRTLVGIVTGIIGVTGLLLAPLHYVTFGQVLTVTGLAFLLPIRLLDGKRQLSGWREQTRWQQTIDQWVEDETSPMHKPWSNAYVTQVSTCGDADNPLTILRIKVEGSVDNVFKPGAEAVKPAAFEAGYNYVELLGAKQRKKGVDIFSPTVCRLVLGRDESAVPDITVKSAGEKTASLVADLAYAQVGHLYHKTPPLLEAHDVSADESRAAWLLTFTQPPTGGDMIDNIGISWLANDINPGGIMGLDVFRDLYDRFHLAADPDTPLSDKGNDLKTSDGHPCRTPNVVTRAKPFGEYIRLSRRYKAERDRWTELLGPKIMPPEPLFDEERTHDCNGWQLRIVPYMIKPPFTVADYARKDLSSFDPSAVFVGMCGSGEGRMRLVFAQNAAPTRLDQLAEPQSYIRAYANAIVLKSLLNELPSKATVSIDSCSQEGRGVAIWRIQFTLGNGATVADLRRKEANIQAAIGVNIIYWEFTTASEGVIWAMPGNLLGIEDARKFKRPITQKRLIPLALSDAWGEAGVQDSRGSTPQVVDIGALPNNHSVLKVRFRVPAGIDVDKPAHNIGKFLTAADYSYGRVLPRGDEHGSADFDMVLAKQSPFPTMVHADWDFARQAKPRMFPLGVDDMGEPVYWNVKDTFHLLICGKSGTGKSSAAQIVVAEALLKGHAIILVDPSKGCIDFTQWARPKALAFVGLGQLREAEAVITWLRHEMAERVKIFSRYGVGSIYDLDKSQLTSDELKHMQPIDLVFDEFNSYLQEAGKTTQNPNKDIQLTNDNAAISATNNSIRRTMSMLSKIVVQGRTAGISVILGAQRLTSDDMKAYNGTAFFKSLGRILLGMDSTSGVFSQQNLSEANRLQHSLKGAGGKIPQGRGIFETAQGELLAVQTWYSGGQEALSELVEDIPAPEPIDYQQYMPAEAEKFGEVNEEELGQLLDQANDMRESENGGEQVDDSQLSEMLGHEDESEETIEEVDW